MNQDFTQWIKPSELVGAPGLPGTHQNINAFIRRSGIPTRPHNGRGGGHEVNIKHLPERTKAYFIVKNLKKSFEDNLNNPKTAEQSKRNALWRLYGTCPDSLKDAAHRKLQVVLAVSELIVCGEKPGVAKKIVSQETGFSLRSVNRWLKRVTGLHRSDWLPALLPRYQGRQTEAYIPPQAWEYFKADWLRVEKPSAQGVYRRMKRAANHNGWGEVPSLKTFMRRLEREIPKPAVILAREGREALKRSYPAQERDKSVFNALQSVNADGHKFDVFAKFTDGDICRPIVVAWQDLFSGKILSWRVTKTENTDTIRLSFGDIIENHGIPESAYLDNGRGFASKWMTGGAQNRYRFKIRPEDPTGIMVQCGVEVHFCTPYWGQAKPVERTFKDLCDSVSKHPRFAGAYTGNNPSAKPENYGSKAIPINVFLEVLGQEIIFHNARQGRRSKICAGRSFDDAFNESYAVSTIQKATKDQRRLWLLAAEGVTASRHDGSITFLKNRYFSDELAKYAGSKLVVRFDPDNLHGNIFVETLDGRFIGEAECVQAAGFNDTTAAREHNRKRNQYMKATKKQLEAERSMTAIEAANMLPGVKPPETPISKVVKPPFKKTARADVSQDQFSDYFDAGWKTLSRGQKSTG